MALLTTTLFGSDSVKQFTEVDFELDGGNIGKIKHKDCCIVLFYGENKESIDLAKIWYDVARQTAGYTLCACNLIKEKKVAQMLIELKSDGNNPLHWAGLRGYPVIITYRAGWPVAAYNGERSVQTLLDYVMTLACQANYREPIQVAASAISDVKLEMPGSKSYIGKEIKTDSAQFTTDSPIRSESTKTETHVTTSTPINVASTTESGAKPVTTH